MDVDDDTITEIRENTAVTREKVEQLEERFDANNEKIGKNASDISDNATEIAKIKATGGLLALLATILAGLHGWVVPFL